MKLRHAAATKAVVRAWTTEYARTCALLGLRRESIPRCKVMGHEIAAVAWEALVKARIPHDSAIRNAAFRELESLTLGDGNNKLQNYVGVH